MKVRCFLSALLISAALLNADAGKPIKVACVGNSITYGIGVANREINCYPAQLGRLLGEDYDVRNFGVPGATLLKQGHKPYVDQIEFKNALAFTPDIAVIHLGINDTDPRNWPNYGDHFVDDYLALIDSFKVINPDVRVILANLSPITAAHRRFSTGTRQWRTSIRKKITEIAGISGSELIDFGQLLVDRQNLIPDAVHPDSIGATIMANHVRNTITGDFGGLAMPEIYSSGMVLQRYKPLLISGTANRNDTIKVQLGNLQATSIPDCEGKWNVLFAPQAESRGLKLIVSNATDTIVYDNVAIGEVWLASGQSNMEFQLRFCETFSQDTLEADDPDLRFFDLKPKVLTGPEEWSEAQKDSVDALSYYIPATWRASSPSKSEEFSAVAWHFGKMLRDSLHVPVGIISNAIGGSGAEAWIDIETIGEQMPFMMANWMNNDYLQPWVRQRAKENIGTTGAHRHPYEPGYLFATGIRPLAHYPLAGVIWYQGESNAHNPELHDELFGILLKSWRDYWQEPALPFIYTQLSSLSRPSWPEFRDHQRRLLYTSGATGMAVTSDVGDSLDVHPHDKKPVGHRLAKWALNKVYSNQHVTPSGPLVRNIYSDSPGSVIVEFDYGRGMTSSDGQAIRGFEMSDFDGNYRPANVEVIDDNIIKLTNMDIPAPRYIRYAWQPFTRANLINSDSLPASTFKFVLDQQPDVEAGITSGVSACYAGAIGDRVVMAGGCNFPTNPIAPDAVKKFYSGIYELLDNNGSVELKKLGSLPQPMAYGAAVSVPEHIYLIGGTTPDKSLSSVYDLSFDSKGKLLLTPMPSLPATIDNMGACHLDGIIYVAGGNVNGEPANTLFALNLEEQSKGWQKLKDFPGNPRVQPVVAASGDKLYLWGGFAGKSSDREATLDTSGLIYFPSKKRWTAAPAPKDSLGNDVSLGGGTACTLPDGCIVLSGGVNKDIFIEALRNQAPDYLSHPVEWYRFNKDVFIYNPADNSFTIAASTPEAARAGSSAVLLPDSRIMLIGGEIKPRIRTANIELFKF